MLRRFPGLSSIVERKIRAHISLDIFVLLAEDGKHAEFLESRLTRWLKPPYG